MGYLFCRLFHGILWYSALSATTRDNVYCTYGICKCGREYLKSKKTKQVMYIGMNSPKS